MDNLIATLCKKYAVEPSQIDELYISDPDRFEAAVRLVAAGFSKMWIDHFWVPMYGTHISEDTLDTWLRGWLVGHVAAITRMDWIDRASIEDMDPAIVDQLLSPFNEDAQERIRFLAQQRADYWKEPNAWGDDDSLIGILIEYVLHEGILPRWTPLIEEIRNLPISS